MKKKIISFITSATMALTCLGGGFSEITSNLNLISEPIVAEAATYSDTISYGDYLTIQKVDEDDDGTYDYIQIAGCDESATSVEIPSEIEGLPVTSIKESAFYGCDFESITIPDSVTSIGIYAFSYCTNLISITIPNNVTEIGNHTFSYCTSIESITIPNGVTRIGTQSFENCTSLISVTLPDSVEALESFAFYNCTSLESITIENPDCDITIGGNLTIHRTATIYGYTGSTAQEYAEYHSRDFVALEESVVTTTMPVTTSSTTTSVTTSTTVTTSVKELLYTETVPVTYPETANVETVAINTFGEQTYSYDDSEFNLDDIIFDITYVERYRSQVVVEYYWSDGSQTSEMVYGNPVEYTFNRQQYLTEFDYTLEYQSPAEMYEALGLQGYEEETINIAFTSTIRFNSYSNSYEFTGEIPITFKPKEITYTCGSNLTATYTKGILTISGTGDMYDYGVYTIPWYNEREEIKTVIVEDGVTSIGVCAFYNLVNLENITLPDSITSIGSQAFSGTPVYSNGKKNSVYYIGKWVIKCDETADTVELRDDTVGLAEYAFCIWENLTDITLPDSLIYIDDYAFSGCTGLESITIPDSVKVIGSNAFHGCNKIKKIIIPSTVETIEEKALGYSSSDTLISGYKIYGASGTAAEEYALENGITFVDINNSAMLSETTLNLSIGEGKLLTIKNNSSNVVWTSENPAVATVSSGYVEAVSAGKTIVYAIIGEEVLTCEVTVSEKENITTTVTVTTTPAKTTTTTVVTTSIPIVTSISPITSLYQRAYHLDINNLSNKTNYNIGDELDLTGLKVDLTYNDESNIYHNTDYINAYPLDYPDVFTVDTSKFDNSKAGTYTIEISCKYEYLHWFLPSAYLKVIVSDSGSSATTTTFTSTSSTDITTTETTTVTTETNTEHTTIPVTTQSSATTAVTTTSTSTTVDTDIFDVKEVDGGIIIIDCDTLVVNVTVPTEINGVEVIKINDYVFSSSDLKTITFDNPSVIIADSETTINGKAVIFGYTGSTAEAYEEKYDRIFVSLDEETKPDYIQGDITGDGLINIYDAIDICKYIMGMKTLTSEEETMADFDGNGVVDLYDAIGIAKKLLD